MAIPGWLKSKKFLTGFVVALTVASATIITVAVLTEPDRELLKVCWQGEIAIYVSGTEGPTAEDACDDPKPLIWPQGDHLTVSVTSPVEGLLEDPPSEVEAAMELVNSQLETHLRFVRKEGSDIRVHWRKVYEANEGTLGQADGYCIHKRKNGSMVAEMVVRAAGSNRLEYRKAIHEFGHCLGLPHDDRGIMKPIVRDDSMDEKMEFDRFGDGQQELIKKTYPD